MNNKKIIKKAQEIYNKDGQSAVFDFANENNIEYEYCNACETNSPSIEHECLVCGEQTFDKLSDEEKELLSQTLSDAYNMRLKLINNNADLISLEARNAILKDANAIDDLRIKLSNIL